MSLPERPPHYLAVRPAWLARRTEPVLEPALPIVDAHHHLWERDGWRYMADELREDVGSGHNVVATVFMQARTRYRREGPPELRPVGETEFAASVAAEADGCGASPGLCAAIVGHADLTLGARVRAVLEAHVEAGAGRFRGVRHLTAWDADASLLNPLSAGPPALLSDPAYLEGLAELAPLGLSYDAWLFQPQLPELLVVARRFPDLTMILNHAGGPLGTGAYEGRRDALFAAWARDVRLLAACPNVNVKLGGLGMRINGFGFEAAPDPPHSVDLATAWQPYVDTCVEAFGAGRCMFESNFPVDKGSTSYRACWNAFKRLTHGVSDAERASLFAGTAERVYRLAPTPRGS